MRVFSISFFILAALSTIALFQNCSSRSGGSPTSGGTSGEQVAKNEYLSEGGRFNKVGRFESADLTSLKELGMHAIAGRYLVYGTRPSTELKVLDLNEPSKGIRTIAMAGQVEGVDNTYDPATLEVRPSVLQVMVYGAGVMLVDLTDVDHPVVSVDNRNSPYSSRSYEDNPFAGEGFEIQFYNTGLKASVGSSTPATLIPIEKAGLYPRSAMVQKTKKSMAVFFCEKELKPTDNESSDCELVKYDMSIPAEPKIVASIPIKDQLFTWNEMSPNVFYGTDAQGAFAIDLRDDTLSIDDRFPLPSKPSFYAIYDKYFLTLDNTGLTIFLTWEP